MAKPTQFFTRRVNGNQISGPFQIQVGQRGPDYGPDADIEILEVLPPKVVRTAPAPVGALVATQPSAATITAGEAFTDNVLARVSGGTAPYTLAQVPGSPLPAGVTISGGSVTASGLTAGSYSWSVRVTDSALEPQAVVVSYALTVEAVAVVMPSLAVRNDQTIILDNVTPESGTVSFTLADNYAGTYTVNTADLAAGPVCIVPPAVVEASGNPGFLVMIPALWVSLSEAITTVRRFVRDDEVLPDTGLAFDIYPAYEIDEDADGGKTIYPRETATDANGARSAQPTVGYAVAPPVGGIATGLTDLGAQAPNQAAAADRSMSVALGAADPDKNIVLVLAMDGSMTTTTVRIEKDGTEYPLSLVQTVSSGGFRVRIFEGPVPVGGTGLLKFTQAVAFERITVAHLLTRKGTPRKTTSQLALTATAGTPITATVNMAANDYAVYAVVAAPGGGEFSGTTFGTEILDVPVGTPATPARLYIGLGQATAANASQALSVTPPTSGSAGYVTAVYGA